MNDRTAHFRRIAHVSLSGHVRAVVTAFLLLGIAATAPAQAEDAHLTVEEHEGTYRVRGEFAIALPASAAWTVLADYDHIPDFVSSMRSSSLEHVEGGYLRVRQEAVAGVFPFRRTIHVLLDIREDAGKRIAFTDVLLKDFRSYSGEWRVIPGPKGTTVHYALDAHLRSGVPGMLGRGMMSRSARELLTEVQSEINRRGAIVRASPKQEPRAD